MVCWLLVRFNGSGQGGAAGGAAGGAGAAVVALEVASLWIVKLRWPRLSIKLEGRE